MNNELTTTNKEISEIKQNADSERVAKEVEAAVICAKKFPRDINNACLRIAKACERYKIAENAMYSYNRGGKIVTGASIRLAEVIAQNYGNIQAGVRELSQNNGSSEVEAYAWDIETNSRISKVFTVKHIRDTRQGKKELKDERDIYEIVANSGARRMRACILAIIPADIVEDAIEICEKTIVKGRDNETLDQRIQKMIRAYDKLGIKKIMIEKRLGHKIDSIDAKEFVELSKIYSTIRDGAADRESFFEISEKSIINNEAEKLNELLKEKEETKDGKML